MLRTELSSIEQLQEEYMKDKTQIKYDFNSDKKGFEISTQDVYYLDFEEVLSKISEAIEMVKQVFHYKIYTRFQRMNKI